MLLALGASPVEGFSAMFDGAFGSSSRIAATAVKATPLILVGAGITIAFRTNVINIGGESQIIAGALLSTVVALNLPDLPAILLVPTVLMAGVIGGGIAGAMPGALKAYASVNEILSTIMLNLVMVQFMNYLLRGPLIDPYEMEAGTRIPQTQRLSDNAMLPNLIDGTRLHLGVPVAIVAAVGAYLLLWRTPTGSCWGPPEEQVRPNCGHDRHGDSEVEPRAVDQVGKHRVVGKSLCLGNSGSRLHFVGVNQRAPQEVVHELDHHEVEHDRAQDLVYGGVGLERPGHGPRNSASDHACHEDRRHKEDGGQIWKVQRDNGGEKRSGDDLALPTDVDHICPEGDRDACAHQNQRGGLDCRCGDTRTASECPVEHRAETLDWTGSERQEHGCSKRQGDYCSQEWN